MEDRWGQWHVFDGSASCNYIDPPNQTQVYETETEAVEAAHNYGGPDYYTEYGIQRIGKEEQLDGLLEQIRDLSERAHLLQTTGRQYKPFED